MHLHTLSTIRSHQDPQTSQVPVRVACQYGTVGSRREKFPVAGGWGCAADLDTHVAVYGSVAAVRCWRESLVSIGVTSAHCIVLLPPPSLPLSLLARSLAGSSLPQEWGRVTGSCAGAHAAELAPMG